MRKLGLYSSLFIALFSTLFSQQIHRADEITYEWLIDEGNTSGYTDHIPQFCELFKNFKVKTLLEFGLGFSTKYFLDSCSSVISVEFITNGSGPQWMQQCLSLYEDFPNWIPIAYFSSWPGDVSWAPYKYRGSEQVHIATSYQCSTHKDYSLIDNTYLKELDAFIGNLVKCHQIDCAFVDPGIYIRGDLVTLLFNKVPIVVAHDTNVRILGHQGDVYGYSRIITPENYEEIPIAWGKGTTIWIKREAVFDDLISCLKEYAKTFAP